jgi:hypothetical protein
MKNTQHHFTPHRSIIYGWYLILIHLFAVICVCLVTSIFWVPVFLILGVLSFLFYFFRTPIIMSLQLVRKREWMLILADQSIERAELLASSVMMRHCIILHFKIMNSGKKRTSLLWSDAFSPQDFQMLRRAVKMHFL